MKRFSGYVIELWSEGFEVLVKVFSRLVLPGFQAADAGRQEVSYFLMSELFREFSFPLCAEARDASSEDEAFGGKIVRGRF